MNVIVDGIPTEATIWKYLKNLIDSLILDLCGVDPSILQTIDFLFNNYEINRSIPSDFTSTLCLLINNLYLLNDSLTESGNPNNPNNPNNPSNARKMSNGGDNSSSIKGVDEVFNCYLAIINYCYIIYNNIWAAYEAKMEQNQFGMCKLFILPLVALILKL